MPWRGARIVEPPDTLEFVADKIPGVLAREPRGPGDQRPIALCVAIKGRHYLTPPRSTLSGTVPIDAPRRLLKGARPESTCRDRNVSLCPCLPQLIKNRAHEPSGR